MTISIDRQRQAIFAVSPEGRAARKEAKEAEARKAPAIAPARQAQAIANAVERKEPRPPWAGG